MAKKEDGETLTDYLSGRVFADINGNTVSPSQKDVDGINEYMKKYLSGIAAVKAAAPEK
jgi:hypothetical protein